MKLKEIVKLMLESSNTNPYSGTLSERNNLIAAIDLSKLCKKLPIIIKWMKQ